MCGQTLATPVPSESARLSLVDHCRTGGMLMSGQNAVHRCENGDVGRLMFLGVRSAAKTAKENQS
jgi:hypothetical protein